MSNTYFKYKKEILGEITEIMLTAVDIPAHPNSISINIHNSLDNNMRVWTNIVLTEEEQNKLIAGILERRGMNVEHHNKGRFDIEMHSSTDSKDEVIVARTNRNSASITATGNEKSRICPAEE